MKQHPVLKLFHHGVYGPRRIKNLIDVAVSFAAKTSEVEYVRNCKNCACVFHQERELPHSNAHIVAHVGAYQPFQYFEINMQSWIVFIKLPRRIRIAVVAVSNVHNVVMRAALSHHFPK